VSGSDLSTAEAVAFLTMVTVTAAVVAVAAALVVGAVVLRIIR